MIDGTEINKTCRAVLNLEIKLDKQWSCFFLYVRACNVLQALTFLAPVTVLHYAFFFFWSEENLVQKTPSDLIYT